VTFCQFAAEFFCSVGLGLGQKDSPQVRFRKSISNERTFSATEDEVLLHKKLGIHLAYYRFTFKGKLFDCKCGHRKLFGLCSTSLLKLVSGFQLIWIAAFNPLHILDFSKSLAVDCVTLSF